MLDKNIQPEELKNVNLESLPLLEDSNTNENLPENQNQPKINNDCLKYFLEIREKQDLLIKEIEVIKETIKNSQELIIKEIKELKHDLNNSKKDSLDTHKKTLSTKRTQSRVSKKYEPPIIPVAYLQEKGKDNLQKELEIMTDDELKQMNQLFLKTSKKELDKIERQTMIENLMTYAERELNRGSKFLEDR